ncbi:MAG: hypothetical protein ACRC7O_12815 [Fimbriiglobus sp.]
MADVRQRTTLGNRFRFLLRVVGLTAGMLVVPVSAALFFADLPPVAGLAAADATDIGQKALAGEYGTTAAAAGVALAAGLIALGVWAVVEIVSGLFLVTGQKTAAGTQNAVQVGLAVALLVVVNAIAFTDYRKWDVTRTQEFTLAPEQTEQLGKLRTDAPTTIVVLQLHKTAGTLSDKPDAYDYAAERKTVEKVRDLVDQLREFGPRFNVVVLDIEDESFERRLRDVTKRRPGLLAAVREAPENSIFFYADGKVRKEPRAVADKLAGGSASPAVAPDPDDGGAALVYPAAVTRMSFTEFFQLDKTASREATAAEREGVAAVLGGVSFAPGVSGKGNLVLIPQGREAFLARVLALEERRPRVGLAVIHPYLTSREDVDEYSASGMRKSLEANGFDVVDVILKRWTRGGPPSPAAYTYEESELERIENRYNLFATLTADRELAIAIFTAAKKDAETNLAAAEKATTDADRIAAIAVAAKPLQRFVRGRIQTTTQIRTVLGSLNATVDDLRADLADLSKQLAEVGPKYRDLTRDERATENRRVTDIRAKLKQYVDDCDVLIVPRLTTLDVAKGEIITPSLFNVSKDQAAVVREFIAAGKPVLFALGPTNIGRAPAGGDGPDEVETLLTRLGVELGRQTILTNPEAQAMAERRDEALGSNVDVPPLSFDVPAGDTSKTRENPVAAAFRTTSRAVDRKLDVKRSGYRPVYVAPGFGDRQPFPPDVMFTVRESWNEEKPLPDDDTPPRFDAAKPDDPKKGTRDEERRGPFSVGVTLEVPVPVEWLDARDLPAGSVTSAAAVGVAGASRVATTFGDEEKIAAVLPAFDGGLSAALLTVAADKMARPTVRLAVYGHGGLFTGRKLDPANETLLLHTLNWQLHRDDRLPHDADDAGKWRYPRAALTDREFFLWRWGTFAGLPLACGFLGLVVLMARKVR